MLIHRTFQCLQSAVLTALVFAGVLCFVGSQTFADTFEYVDEDGREQHVEARFYGAGQGAIALELADGSLSIIPQGALKKRTPGDDPVPLTPQEMLTRLEGEFGEELFRGRVEKQYVVGVVLTAPLPKSSERRVDANLLKAARYMGGIENMFQRFCKSMKIEHEDPKFPLVVLIFETDDDFNAYTTKHTGGNGLSAENIAGFYSPQTNYLYVRMSECYSFATPLHEAIHQQCFNTRVLSRLAPLPVWFSEGMATGFEGNGDKIQSDPFRLNAVYARLISQSGGLPPQMSWNDVVTTDQVFRGDIFAGSAYVHAWSMHWLLVSRFRKEYPEYLRYLSTLEPLAEESTRIRSARFEEIFGATPNEIQQKFAPAFEAAMKRFKPPADSEERPGTISRITNLAGVDAYAESDGFRMKVQTQLRNLSPLREMAFVVTVVSDSGSASQWYLPNMKINEFKLLEPRTLRGRGFNVMVQSTPADSETNARWSRGQLPTVGLRR
ncbi:MAG: DUF1570 domain-containing protein [Rhodopirellula sp.]|nr:DUF1570 domain-containing protein [Rhodopirellula sp.]